MMSVTVLIPSYNHAPFVARALRSVFAQTVAPKKLIVIDDGSKDESIAVIEQTLNDCPFDFEFVKRENRGLCRTLNEGFARADSEYFAYISSDDAWLPDFLKSRAALLKIRPQAVLAYGYSYLIDEADYIIDSTKNWGAYADGDALSMLLRPTIPASASVLYRRSALEKFRWNENSILEDYELYLRLTTAGEFALDENILSAWRIHGYNTSADFGLMKDEWLAAQCLVASEIGLSEKELDEIQRRINFNSVADFLRQGKRRAAFDLFRRNLGGAANFSAAAKIFLRFFVPTEFFVRRRKLVERQNTKNFGKLNL